jgi:hypothetical protein
MVDCYHEKITLMWHGDLGPTITKKALQRQIKLSRKQALRLSFWIQLYDNESNSSSFTSNLTYLTTVDIPLSTGVVGHAGPHIRASTHSSVSDKTVSGYPSRFHPAAESQSALLQKPVNALICLAIFGKASVKHLPEFITHHVDVGFEQIVIGALDSGMDEGIMGDVQAAVQPYIDEGIVNLAAAGIPFTTCDEEVTKLPFLSSCLYHAKGTAKYVAAWDIDEFWVPPWLSNNSIAGNKQELLVSSFLAQDSIWKGSPYPEFQTISGLMSAVATFQEEADCGQKWCFHAMTSALIEPTLNRPFRKRSIKIVEDFEGRRPFLGMTWSKSIALTKFTYMMGVHQPGSCKFSENGPYLTQPLVSVHQLPSNNLTRYREMGECRNLVFTETLDFGIMHHFYSLVADRLLGGSRENLTKDEYVLLFGETVQQQINATFQKFAQVTE